MLDVQALRPTESRCWYGVRVPQPAVKAEGKRHILQVPQRNQPDSTMASRSTGSTLAALNAQIAALQAQAEALRKKEVGDIIAKAKDAIAHYGLTAADLGLGKAPRKTGVSTGPKLARKARKNASAKKGAKFVKFKDDQGHTWGGMGKRPDWFKAALAAGKTPEDLLAKG